MREDEAREALERVLRASTTRQACGPSSASRRILYALEALRAAGEKVERRLGGQARAEERLVDSVARERVDQPGGVAHEQHTPAGDRLGGRRIGSR